ncbi:Pr6Pr family membrane protein [Nocardioides sp. 1609]|uniref:Pr6Pr family membrane protein n=1 Tax=Nocardioides sp. 1609 TaxID=2508327 RepID=UPI00106F3171|nr:Pr6Pr family membrane protein [Nocardioides sp. 1609]
MNAARTWHAATAALAVGGLTLQLVLVVIGNPVLAEVEPPGLGMRLYRFAAYFTVESNALVAFAALTLVRNPQRDGRAWRVLRLAGVVAITVTALVHFVLLRPLLDLEGWDYVADKVLHMGVPALAILGWVCFGPRPRVSSATVWVALALPLGWTVWTLAFGQVDGWYPYPFLDPDAEGWPHVAVALAGVTTLFVALSLAARWWDRRPAGVADPPT